ncbi:hypothetical protein FOA52_007579 [Chlamydomonas sp. UWO 241]|nr:hypothetical protein FOA52_007579 [Chlamydomonas sp. UWO 241]
MQRSAVQGGLHRSGVRPCAPAPLRPCAPDARRSRVVARAGGGSTPSILNLLGPGGAPGSLSTQAAAAPVADLPGIQLSMPQLPEQLSGLQLPQLAGMSPHWGTARFADAVSQLRAGPAQSLEQAQQALASALPASLPSLPQLPSSLPSLPVSLSVSLPGLPAELLSAVSAAGDGATSAAGALLSAAGEGGGHGSAAVAPHFGARILGRAGAGLSDWASSGLASLQTAALSLPASISGGGGGDGNGSGGGRLAPGLVSALAELRGALGELQTNTQLLLATLPSPGSDVALSADGARAALGALAQQQAAAVAGVVGNALPGAGAAVSRVAAALEAAQANGLGGHSLLLVGVLTLVVGAGVVASMPNKKYDGYSDLLPFDDPAKLGHAYDAAEVEEYFRRRPVSVALRSAQIATEMAGFGASLLTDIWTGRREANEPARAAQLRGVIERLGPAFVKVAQAISTRVDLLPPAYFTQIALLQDRVPPFPCDEAYAAMEAAFGQPPSAVFSAISTKPVAAASLGQVYRATLRDGGGEVAVKVLRPGVLERVGLDLYLIRNAGASFNATKQMNTDWVGVIDEWALRFFAEMDYEREARNGARLANDLSRLPGVLVPSVVPSLSTGEGCIRGHATHLFSRRGPP